MKPFLNKLFPHTDKYGFPKDSIIIDVSLKKDYEAAHKIDAVNIPIAILFQMVDVIKEYNKTVVVISKSHNLSEAAYRTLINANVDAYNGGNWNKLNNISPDYKKGRFNKFYK